MQCFDAELTFSTAGVDVESYIPRQGSTLQSTLRNQPDVSLLVSQVVQLYLTWNNASLPAPKLQLVGFERVHVRAGQKVSVRFRVSGQQMELWFDSISGFNVVPGEKRINLFIAQNSYLFPRALCCAKRLVHCCRHGDNLRRWTTATSEDNNS